MSTRTGDARVAARLPARVRSGLLRLALLPLALLLLLGAGDPVEFYATVGSPTAQLGDPISVKVVLSLDTAGGEPAELKIPVMQDLDVAGKQQSSQTQLRMDASGTHVTRSMVVSLRLMARRTGVLTIEPFQTVIGGRAYATSPLTVKVLPRDPNRADPNAQQNDEPVDPLQQRLQQQMQQLQQMQQMFGGGLAGGGGDPFEEMLGSGAPPNENDLFLRASLDKKEAWLGEQVTLSLWLFARVDIGGIEGLKLPKLDSFWNEELETPQNVTGDVKMVNGVPYRAYLLRRRALFGLRAGKQTIEPVELDVLAGISVFGGGTKVHRVSQPLQVELKALPPGAPKEFQSAHVGQWKLSVVTPNGNPVVPATVGQPVALQVVVEGVGNYKNLAPPHLPEVRGLRFFDPTQSDKTQIARLRFGGRRALEYLINPEQTGEFTLPPLSLTFFDPVTGSYQSATTEPVKLVVAAGQGGVTSLGGTAQAGLNAGANVVGTGLLRPVRPTPRLEPESVPLHQRAAFPYLVGSPVALMLLGSVVDAARKRARNEGPEDRRKGAAKRARKLLSGAAALLEQGDSGAYHAAVARALTDWLTDHLGFAAAGLTREELGRRLVESGAEPELVATTLGVLETCEYGRFAPGAQDARRKVLDDATAALVALEAAKLRRLHVEAA